MSMILEYPVNIFILTVVVIVVIGIMFHFRDQIMTICLFPPCEEDTKCDVKIAAVTETNVNSVVLEKYCKMCWYKNRKGECKVDSICYAVNIPNSDLTGITLGSEVSGYCNRVCSRSVTSFFVEYSFIDKKISITC